MKTFVQVPQIIDFVLNNPKYYPGKHNYSQERTSKGLQTICPNRQMKEIWDSMCDYLKLTLENGGKSIKIDYFGAFTFEAIVIPYGHPRNCRSSTLRLRPCFIPESKLKNCLSKYKEKEETPKQEGSIYQQGMNITSLNKSPIASMTYYERRLVTDVLNAIFQGVCDLSERCYNIDLNFKFCRINIVDGNLQVRFSKSFISKLQHVAISMWPNCTISQNPLPTLSTTLENLKNFDSEPSNPGQLVKKDLSSKAMKATKYGRPDSRKMNAQRARAQSLGICSIDLNTCERKPTFSAEIESN